MLCSLHPRILTHRRAFSRFSHPHSNPSSAQLAVITIIFVTGFVAVNAYYIMNSIPKTQNLARVLRKIFRLWPAFNLGDGLVAITGAFWERNVLGMESNPFDWDIAGFPLVLLFVLSIPYFGTFIEHFICSVVSTRLTNNQTISYFPRSGAHLGRDFPNPPTYGRIRVGKVYSRLVRR